MAPALIKLQILIGRIWRTPEGLDEIRRILNSIGLTPTTSGLATISAEVTPEQFESLFGLRAVAIEPQPPGKADFGASGGLGRS